MFQPAPSDYLVDSEKPFRVADQPTSPADGSPGKKECKARLEELVGRLDKLQRKLYADNRYSVLLVFQAIDAAGKDSTIRAVLSGINPAGCQVSSFKKPSEEELDHDYLWRTTRRLPERGRIGVFNRSYYEEVLVVRVHPEYLDYQRLPHPPALDTLWQQRFASIRHHEEHLSRNGTVILKFWLNVSRDQQRRRFLRRIDDPDRNWKFAEGDVTERARWGDYMQAYEEAIWATHRPWAPWYTIPADDKAFMRMEVARILVETLDRLDLSYPVVDEERLREFERLRKLLKND